ncbi:MAG: PAS domain S-box protein [Ferruginibacter sp.]
MIKDKKNYDILVIEDNPGDFTLIEDYLEEQIRTPQITQVKNFAAAKSLLEHKEIYDVILLDLSLPDKSGEQLITEINSLCPVCPVIVLTGYTDIAFSIKSLSLGIADYLLKEDITATSLYKSIVYNIERKKTNIELKESEKRYSNLFHLSPQPMWVYDQETFRFIQVNKAAIELYGYSESEFLEMTAMDIRPKQDRQAFKEMLQKFFSENQNIITGRFRHIKKTNEMMEVEIYSNLVTINDKEYRSVISIDITEKLLMEKQILDQKVGEQKRITIAVVNAQEKEKAAIGEEMHDNVNQLLAASKLYMGHCLSLREFSRDDIVKSLQYVTEAMEEIRKLSHILVGPAQEKAIGLIYSIEELVTNMSILKTTKVSFNHSTYNEEKSELGLKLVIFRIIQEQMNNILKYAEATEIEIELKNEETDLIVSINDNGKGLNTSANREGIGLRNIKNRAEVYNGIMRIVSSPGKGCKLKIIFKDINKEELKDEAIFPVTLALG